MKKLLTILLILSFTFWRSYPLKQVAKPWCKFEIWQNLTEDCKMPLPIIKNAEYKKYKDNIKYRLIYSVLWLSTYKNWWDIGYWSHLWVDIASSYWTPVYSIWNWTVEKAGYLKWRGNTVVIKHNLKNSKKIRSIYAHLSKILVKKGQLVKEWQKIWEIWHSGYAWGNHLHFQIDINPTTFHPYYYNGCWNPAVVVNKGLCKNKVIANTIDPIKFLETNWAILPKYSTEKQIYQYNKKFVEKQKIHPKQIVPREKLMLTELELFLARYKFNLKSLIPANVLFKWKQWKLILYVKNKRGKPFKWVLPKDIQIILTNPKILKVFPKAIKYIPNWQRQIDVYGIKPWTTDIIIKIDWKTLFRKTIRVIDKNTKILPTSAYGILTTKYPHIWDEFRWLIIFRDKNFNNIINVPFIWTYTIKIYNWMLCPINIKLNQLKRLRFFKCYTKNAIDKITISYNNTLKWIFLFKVLPTIPWKPILINIYNSKWKKIGNIKSYHTITYPLDISSNNYSLNRKYIPYIKKSLTNLITRNYKLGKFVPDFKLRKVDAIYWVKNLKYKIFKNDSLSWIPSKNNYEISRLDFIKLIAKNLNIYSKTNKRIFLDVNKTDWKYTNILYDFNAKFLDKFWKRFFQPNKNITRQEAAYILEKIYENLIKK